MLWQHTTTIQKTKKSAPPTSYHTNDTTQRGQPKQKPRTTHNQRTHTALQTRHTTTKSNYDISFSPTRRNHTHVGIARREHPSNRKVKNMTTKTRGGFVLLRKESIFQNIRILGFFWGQSKLFSDETPKTKFGLRFQIKPKNQNHLSHNQIWS